MTKAERLVARESALTHAMCLTGVDLVDGTARRWRVENSWGDKLGDKGFHTMSDSWFDEYVFEVVVRPGRLPGEVRAALETEPIMLPAGTRWPEAAGRTSGPTSAFLRHFPDIFRPFSGGPSQASSHLLQLRFALERDQIIRRRTRRWHVEDGDSKVRCSRRCACRSTGSRSPECAISRPTRS